MRILVTGATGHVGRAVTEALLQAGHVVTALVRSTDRARTLKQWPGLYLLYGDLRQPETYSEAAASHEAVVHMGFEYSANGDELAQVDRLAVATLVEAAHRSPTCRGLVYTSNAFLLADMGTDATVDEQTDPAQAKHPGAWRLAHEGIILDASTETLATAVVRLGAVYGGKGGSLGDLFSEATRARTSTFVAPGTQRWSLIYRGDLAALYRAIVETRARGVFHGVDGSPMSMREIAETVSNVVGNCRTTAISVEAARACLPYFSSVLCRDLAMTTARALALGWQPRHRSFAHGAADAYTEWLSGALPSKP
ncbi:MAG: NAD(P)H-binding protein [Deltaproteobacteria bacterium]|nr:NAD(P)H-binding protein [Deltaproteobacteria bacterium]